MISMHLLTPTLITFLHNQKKIVIKYISNAYLSYPSFARWKDATRLEILDHVVLKWKLYIPYLKHFCPHSERRQICLV